MPFSVFAVVVVVAGLITFVVGFEVLTEVFVSLVGTVLDSGTDCVLDIGGLAGDLVRIARYEEKDVV